VIIQPSAACFLSVFPAGQSGPATSTLNARAGQVRANNAIVALGPSGDLTAFLGQAGGSAGLVVDVNGYFK